MTCCCVEMINRENYRVVGGDFRVAGRHPVIMVGETLICLVQLLYLFKYCSAVHLGMCQYVVFPLHSTEMLKIRVSCSYLGYNSLKNIKGSKQSL